MRQDDSTTDSVLRFLNRIKKRAIVNGFNILGFKNPSILNPLKIERFIRSLKSANFSRCNISISKSPHAPDTPRTKTVGHLFPPRIPSCVGVPLSLRRPHRAPSDSHFQPPPPRRHPSSKALGLSIKSPLVPAPPPTPISATISIFVVSSSSLPPPALQIASQSFSLLNRTALTALTEALRRPAKTAFLFPLTDQPSTSPIPSAALTPFTFLRLAPCPQLSSPSSPSVPKSDPQPVLQRGALKQSTDTPSSCPLLPAFKSLPPYFLSSRPPHFSPAPPLRPSLSSPRSLPPHTPPPS